MRSDLSALSSLVNQDASIFAEKEHKALMDLHAECPAVLEALSANDKRAVASTMVELLETQLEDETFFADPSWVSTASHVIQLAVTLAGAVEDLQARVSRVQTYLNLVETQLSILESSGNLPGLPLDDMESAKIAEHIRMLESMSKPYAQMKAWLTSLQNSAVPPIDTVAKSVESFQQGLSAKAAALAKAKLEASITALKGIGEGGEKGQSWKSSLSKKPLWSDVKREASTICNIEYAGRLKKAFSVASQDRATPASTSTSQEITLRE